MENSNNRIKLAKLLVFLSMVMFISCNNSKELARSKAAELIKANTAFNQPLTINLKDGMLKDGGLTPSLGESDTPEEAVKRYIHDFILRNPETGIAIFLNLATPQVVARETSPPTPRYTGASAYWSFDENFTTTEKGKSYWKEYGLPASATEIPYARKELIEITGLTPVNEAETGVEYTYRWVPNEIGKYFDSSTPEFKSLPADLQESLLGAPEVHHGNMTTKWTGEARPERALLRRYDDGWRIERIF